MQENKTPELIALEKAVELAGGQTALGRRLGLAQGVIWTWLRRTGRVPPEKAIPIEKIVGGKVTRHELRPDLYPIEDDEVA